MRTILLALILATQCFSFTTLSSSQDDICLETNKTVTPGSGSEPKIIKKHEQILDESSIKFLHQTHEDIIKKFKDEKILDESSLKFLHRTHHILMKSILNSYLEQLDDYERNIQTGSIKHLHQTLMNTQQKNDDTDPKYRYGYWSDRQYSLKQCSHVYLTHRGTEIHVTEVSPYKESVSHDKYLVASDVTEWVRSVGDCNNGRLRHMKLYDDYVHRN